MDTKQVIVMRKDLNMRKGKMIAQGAHASVANILQAQGDKGFESDLNTWLEDSFAKITLSVNSEEELMEIYDKCVNAQLNVKLIEDSGLTEFHGTTTRTCLAIGPHDVEIIDKITSKLKLL